jgi:hypothetical protein
MNGINEIYQKQNNMSAETIKDTDNRVLFDLIRVYPIHLWLITVFDGD